MEEWRKRETLEFMFEHELNKDNKRVIGRVLEWMDGKRQAPTSYQWLLVKSIYDEYFGGEENEYE